MTEASARTLSHRHGIPGRRPGGDQTQFPAPLRTPGLLLWRVAIEDPAHPDAPLILAEYGDYECPFCGRATGAIDEVRAHFGDDLLYVWGDFPLQRAHPRSFDAARAGEGAALQGKFFEMGRELFAHRDDLEWPDMYPYAVAIGSTSSSSTRMSGSTPRRCCTGCATSLRTPR